MIREERLRGLRRVLETALLHQLREFGVKVDGRGVVLTLKTDERASAEGSSSETKSGEQ